MLLKHRNELQKQQEGRTLRRLVSANLWVPPCILHCSFVIIPFLSQFGGWLGMASEINKCMRSYFDVLAHRDPEGKVLRFRVSCGSSKDVRPLSVVAMFHLQTAQFQLCQPPVTFPFSAHCAMCGQGRLDRKWKAVGKESSALK